MNPILKVVGGILTAGAIGGGAYINSQQDALIQKIIPTIEEQATAKIGTQVKVGKVELEELKISSLKPSKIILRDIEIFDKNSEHIATVDEAEVKLKLLNLKDDPAGAVDEINITGAHVDLKKRDDETWNVNDIKIESEGESTFGAKISVAESSLDAEFDGNKISVEEISGSADCADLDAVDTKISAKTLGSQIDATGTLGAENQTVHAKVDSVDIEKILPLIPANTLPENLQIQGGVIENSTVNVTRRGEILNYLGSANLKDGAIKIEDTEVENINGAATFNNSEIVFNASATANGQSANASGTIHTDTDEPFLDIYADSESFSPSAIIQNLGVDGAAKFSAHIAGTAKNPQVEAEIFSDYIAYQNLSARNLKTKVRYSGEEIFLSDLSAETFGGEVEGEGTVLVKDLAYNAHLKVKNLDATQLKNLANISDDLRGNVSGDFSVSGKGADTETLQVYGSATAANVAYQNFPVNYVSTSFSLEGKDLQIDNFKAVLPNKGAVGASGKISGGDNLDLEFYASHIDLALAKNFDPQIDVGGLSDFSGKISGAASNPQINLKATAVDSAKNNGEHFRGQIFKQPYDSVKLAASGNLDGVKIDNFELEHGGKVTWSVTEGTVGFTGAKNIDLTLQTTGARVEDIVALVAPDQPLTGNLNNVVKVTGTLDKPNVVGEIDFKYGSYRGIILRGMHGNYFLEGDMIRLQNFEVTAPMADVTLNGTINKATQDLNFVVEGKNLSLDRLHAQFPREYTAQGDLKFEGVLSGTINYPQFVGNLNADKLNLNGVELSDVHGNAQLQGNQFILDEFEFKQGEGSCKLYATANNVTKMLDGDLEVNNFDIPQLLQLAGYKTNLLTGKLNSKIDLGGTLENPSVNLVGDIGKGELAGYDLHDVAVELNLLNKVIYFNKLEGFQGDAGTFNLSGTANLVGPLDLEFNSDKLNLGIIPAAAGLKNFETAGNFSINAKVGGNVDSPEAEIKLDSSGSIKGATFDFLGGDIFFKNWAFDIQNFEARRQIGEKTYRATAEGILPVQAFMINAENKKTLSAEEQLNLKISLDQADLSLLPTVSNYISWAVGSMGGSVFITGAADNPKVDGNISLSDGTVKVKGMKSLIEHINISTLFKGNRFDIENFTLNIGKGALTVDGGFSFANLLLSDYNFNLKADNLNIDSDFFTGPLNAEFSFQETELPRPENNRKFRLRTLPKISGQIDLEHCLLSVPALPSSDDPLPDILLDISLNLGEKVHFYSSRLYDMYLTGSAHFGRSTTHPKTSGTISVKRGGTINYLQTVFDIREAEILFNQQDSFMPTVHFAADTKLTRTKIYLAVDGPLGKKGITFKLTSSPEMTETEIIQLLTFRTAYDKGNQNFTAADALEIGLQMSVLAEIEDTVKRNLGLDKFMVSRGSGSAFDSMSSQPGENNQRENEFNISLGKYINDKVMLRLTQGINGDQITRYGIQYDFNDNLGLTIERESNEFIFGLEARYNF